MEALTVEQLNKKCETLFNYLKELNKEVKRQGSDDMEIRQEIKNIEDRLKKLELQINKLQSDDVLVIQKKKHYSNKELYELRMKTSIRKAAQLANVSVSTIQRACRAYGANFKDMEV